MRVVICIDGRAGWRWHFGQGLRGNISNVNIMFEMLIIILV